MFDRGKSDALFTDTLDLLDMLNTRDGRFEYADYVALHNNITALYDSFAEVDELQEFAKAQAEGRLVEVVRCRDCDMGFVDKEMSSPDRGWWYGCKDHNNHFKRADGYCSMGVPCEAAEKALGGGQNEN